MYPQGKHAHTDVYSNMGRSEISLCLCIYIWYERERERCKYIYICKHLYIDIDNTCNMKKDHLNLFLHMNLHHVITYYTMCFRYVWIWLQSRFRTNSETLFVSGKSGETLPNWKKDQKSGWLRLLTPKPGLKKKEWILRGSNTHVFHIQLALALVDGQDLPCTKLLQVLRQERAAPKEPRSWTIFFNIGTVCIFQVQSFLECFEMLWGAILICQKASQISIPYIRFFHQW